MKPTKVFSPQPKKVPGLDAVKNGSDPKMMRSVSLVTVKNYKSINKSPAKDSPPTSKSGENEPTTPMKKPLPKKAFKLGSVRAVKSMASVTENVKIKFKKKFKKINLLTNFFLGR